MLIVGNWKAYVESKDKAKKLFAAAKRAATGRKVKVVIAPPAPFIGFFTGDKRSKVAIAAQDISETSGGAATGEMTGGILKEAGVSYVIVGHSERRAFGESDQVILEKVRHALANRITPIVCIGERERDSEAHYLKFLRGQIDAIFKSLSPRERFGIIIAYEPVWAIGHKSSDAITSVELAEMVLYIRKVLSDYLPGKSVNKIPIIYGGSVDPTNIREIAGGSSIDGFLPGRASTDPVVFAALIKAVS